MKLDEAIANAVPVNKGAMERAQKRWLSLAKPLFGLGLLEDAVTKIAGIKGSEIFSLDKKGVVLMCGDNGVVCEGVSQTDQEVTAIVVGNFADHTSTVCIMADKAGADIIPVDIGIAVDVPRVTDKRYKIAYGTENIAQGAAMTRQQAVAAIEAGIAKTLELKRQGYDILATGEMGIGNTTTSSAVASVLLNMPAEAVTGRGAGLSSQGLAKKINVVKRAIQINKPDKNDPLDVLSKLGGYDIAGLTGVFIGGALCGIPVLIDGFISGVSAMLAAQLCPTARGYMLATHVSKEPAGMAVLDALGLKPVITANMSLGEGTGAVAFFPLLDMACSVYTRLNTFGEWNGNREYKVLK